MRSRALRACGIEPIQMSSAAKNVSMPLIRGPPSARKVAIVLVDACVEVSTDLRGELRRGPFELLQRAAPCCYAASW